MEGGGGGINRQGMYLQIKIKKNCWLVYWSEVAGKLNCNTKVP